MSRFSLRALGGVVALTGLMSGSANAQFPGNPGVGTPRPAFSPYLNLNRSGNVLVDSPLLARSGIFRYTLGTAYSLQRGLRLKYSTELWTFSDPGYAGKNSAVSMHIGAATAF